MLPKSSPSVHINPKFRNVHINPSFLNKAISEKVAMPTQIYINPKFLNHSMDSLATMQALASSIDADIEASIPPLACNRLASEPLASTIIPSRSKIIATNNVKTRPIFSSTKSPEMKPLIKIGSRKLIRIGSQPLKSTKIVQTPLTIRRPIQTKYKIVKEQTAYKIDRRSLRAKRSIVRIAKIPSTIGRRSLINECLTPTKIVRR